MQIYLLRHGQQQSNLCNVNTPLSEKGRRQAVMLGRRMASYEIDLVYSSDLIRAVETAHIVLNEIFAATGRKPEHKIREGIREIDFGDLTGIPDPVIEMDYKEFMESRYRCSDDWGYPGGESGEEVINRALPVLEEITSEKLDRIAVVTHGGTIRSLLAHLFQGGQGNRLLYGKHLKRAGFTELYYDTQKMRFYLERFNDYAHLEGDRTLL